MKKITVIILLICGTIFAQTSASTQVAKKQLQNALAYRQDFINRQQNSEWMRQEYGRYEMYKYPWGLRQKTSDRDGIEIDIRVLQYYEKYDMRLTDDLIAGHISENQRIKLNNEIMPMKLYEVLTKNKERVFPESSEECHH